MYVYPCAYDLGTRTIESCHEVIEHESHRTLSASCVLYPSALDQPSSPICSASCPVHQLQLQAAGAKNKSTGEALRGDVQGVLTNVTNIMKGAEPTR